MTTKQKAEEGDHSIQTNHPTTLTHAAKQQARLNLDEGQKSHYRQELERMEAELRREQRRRLTTDDFDPLVIIGRGAFGEVSVCVPLLLVDVGGGRETDMCPHVGGGTDECMTTTYMTPDPLLSPFFVLQVRLVKKKESGEVFAMKSMIKEAMLRKNQVRTLLMQGCVHALRYQTDVPSPPPMHDRKV